MLGPSPADVRRKKPTSRGDLSLSHGDDFFRATAARSMLLAYRFEILLSQYPSRSARHSHPQLALAFPGMIRTTRPLPDLLPIIPDRLQDRRSPPGCDALGIDALNPTPTRRSALAIRPISVRSPLGPRFLFRDHSDHRSRPATFRWACCSSQPLGTINRMRRNAIVVNRKRNSPPVFPEEFSPME